MEIRHLVVLGVVGLPLVAPDPAGGDPPAAGALAPAHEQVAGGAVEGTVRLSEGAMSEPPALSPYARRRYEPPPTPASGGATDVVVFVPVDGAPPSDDTVRITQRDRTILPHVTAIQVGTTVEFPNEDDIFHNLFSLSDPHPFNLGRYPPGDSRTEVFEEAGVVRMFCDIHSEMTGVIRVVETPHVSTADEAGGFRIAGLPVGRQRVVAWHPSAGADTVEVDVPEEGVARVELRLGGGSP